MGKSEGSQIVKDMLRTYIGAGVSRSSAALAYSLMLSVFPTLICLYYMLGSLFPDAEAIESFTRGLLPAGTVDTIVEYLGYVTTNNSSAMLTAAILTMATSSAMSFRTIHNVMGEIMQRERFTGFFALIFSFAFSLLFLAAIYFAVIVMLTGGWFLNLVGEHLKFLHISDNWYWARFILLLALLVLIIYGLYRITSAKGNPVPLFRGAFWAAIVMVGVSILFSLFIGVSARYPLIYGSLASVMILMLWFYICGNIIFLGNILNVVLYRHGK